MKPSQSADSVERASRGLRPWRLAERSAWALGLACLVTWGALLVAGRTGARSDLKRFAALQASASPPQAGAPRQIAGPSPVGAVGAAPDLSLWDAKRITAWRSSLEQAAPAPVAVLRIPKIRLEVAVLPGTDEFVLNRAVGHIEGTALPGTDGNSAIAGHRDGFFRGLKDVGLGDVIEIDTLQGREAYRIERFWVVAPEEVWVLDASPVRSLTLVTCYPFYFVGSAPRRYIVRAVLVDDAVVPTASRRGPASWLAHPRLGRGGPPPQLAMLRLLSSSHAPSGAWRSET